MYLASPAASPSHNPKGLPLLLCFEGFGHDLASRTIYGSRTAPKTTTRLKVVPSIWNASQPAP